MISTSPKGTLNNSTVLITGATGGIGRALVTHCLTQGATVFVAGRDQATLESADYNADKQVFPLVYDVTDEHAVKDAFRQIQKKVSDGVVPPLYGLVNNAGIMMESPLSVTSMDKLKQQLNVNFLAPYQHMQYAARLMSRLRKGSIVNVVSMVSEQGSAGMSAYAASKAALTGATKSLAKELSPVGIRVNAVAPGFIDTPLTAHFEPEARNKVLQRTAMHRAGDPGEVAEAILYLLSPQSSYTTGHILPVDGMFAP